MSRDGGRDRRSATSPGTEQQSTFSGRVNTVWWEILLFPRYGCCLQSEPGRRARTRASNVAHNPPAPGQERQRSMIMVSFVLPAPATPHHHASAAQSACRCYTRTLVVLRRAASRTPYRYGFEHWRREVPIEKQNGPWSVGYFANEL